jgi:hypothetical protein
MKKLITIAILLLSLTSSAQKFEELFTVSDTTEFGETTLYPKSPAIFVCKKDTILLIPVIVYYKSGAWKGLNVHGFWIYSKSEVESFYLVTDSKNKFIKKDFGGDEESNNIYIPTSEKVKTLGSISCITNNGNKYVCRTPDYFKTYLSSFKQLNFSWYE